MLIVYFVGDYGREEKQETIEELNQESSQEAIKE